MDIRDYKDSDYSEVAAILKEATLFSQKLDTVHNLHEKITHSPGSILVAEVEGRVVGTIYIIFDRWQSLIHHLAVKEEYRKQGIGTQLMKEAEIRIENFGSPRVSGTIRENSPHLEKYYTELGYRLAPIMHRYVHKELKQ